MARPELWLLGAPTRNGRRDHGRGAVRPDGGARRRGTAAGVHGGGSSSAGPGPRGNRAKESTVVRLVAARELVIRLWRPREPDVRQGRRDRAFAQGSFRTASTARRGGGRADSGAGPRRRRGSAGVAATCPW